MTARELVYADTDGSRLYVHKVPGGGHAYNATSPDGKMMNSSGAKRLIEKALEASAKRAETSGNFAYARYLRGMAGILPEAPGMRRPTARRRPRKK